MALSSTLLIVSCGHAQNAKDSSQIDTITAVSTVVPALTPSEQQRYTSITGHFFDSMIAGRFNGSVLVAKNGVVLYERYKGFENPRLRKDSLNAHTAFHLASMSKTFTAMGTLKLWQGGKLDIHDSVGKYLAGFPYPAVTIETLLNHRSGLHNYEIGRAHV